MQSPGKLCWQLKSAHQPLLAGLGQAGEEKGFLRHFIPSVQHVHGFRCRLGSMKAKIWF